MNQLFKWLAVVGRLGNQYADQHLVGWNINSSHHAFIVLICKEPGITQDKLRSQVYVHPSNITRALDHLERQGYITKAPLPEDKRTSRLYPTERAKEALVYIRQIMKEWEAVITNDMSEDQREAFGGLLEMAGASATEHFFLNNHNRK